MGKAFFHPWLDPCSLLSSSPGRQPDFMLKALLPFVDQTGVDVVAHGELLVALPIDHGGKGDLNFEPWGITVISAFPAGVTRHRRCGTRRRAHACRHPWRGLLRGIGLSGMHRSIWLCIR